MKYYRLLLEQPVSRLINRPVPVTDVSTKSPSQTGTPTRHDDMTQALKFKSLLHKYNLKKPPPAPEQPLNCCMSGCVNCVWEVYADDYKEYKHTLKTLKDQANQIPNEQDKKELLDLIERKSSDEAVEIDPSIKALIQFEKSKY